MSLESALKELNETNLKLLDATERLISLRQNAVETVKEAAAPAAKKTETDKKGLVETAKEVGAAVDPSKVEEKRKEQTVSEAAAHPIGTLVLKYVGEGYDEADPDAAEERTARSEKVKAMYASIATQLKIEVKSYKDIPEKAFTAVTNKLNTLIEEGNLVIGKKGSTEAPLDL